MLDALIIYRVHHSMRVFNLVPIHKKSGEICLCIDFLNLNCASDKENYLVLLMEHILQIIFGA